MSLTYKYSKWSNVVSYADYLVTAHVARVAQQGGTIDNPALLKLYVQYLVSNNLMSSQYIGAIPSVTGYKIQAATTQNCQIVFSVDPAGSTSGAYIGDMSQATLLNQPKLLKYNGEKYLWSSGVAGNWVDCSSSANTQFTDDIEIIMKVNVNLTLGGQQRFFGQYSTGHTTHYTGLDYYVGNIRFYLDSGSIIATTPNWFTDSVDSWIKVTRTASTGNVVFYKSSDGTNWTVQATVIGLTSGTIIPSTTGISIGSDSNTGGAGLQGGKVYKATFSKVIGGTPTVNFDFTNYNPAVSETTWTATTGETWTLNRPVAYIDSASLKSTIVTRTKIQTTTSLYLSSGKFTPATSYVTIWNTFTNLDTPEALYYRSIYANNSNASIIGSPYLNHMITFNSYSSPYLGYYPYSTAPYVNYPNNNKLTLFTGVIGGGTQISKLQSNKGSISSGLENYFSYFEGITQAVYYGTVSLEDVSYIAIAGDLSLNDAFKDFLNTTIFNGEIY